MHKKSLIFEILLKKISKEFYPDFQCSVKTISIDYTKENNICNYEYKCEIFLDKYIIYLDINKIITNGIESYQNYFSVNEKICYDKSKKDNVISNKIYISDFPDWNLFIEFIEKIFASVLDKIDK